jgi:hypothetical protein
MPEFVVVHAYRSSRDGRQFGPWVAGDLVEVTDADAEWLLRDSPGCLLPVAAEDPDNDPDNEREKPPARNRQARPGRNRGGS